MSFMSHYRHGRFWLFLLDCLFLIFRDLNLDDLRSVRRCCHTWKSIVDHHFLVHPPLRLSDTMATELLSNFPYPNTATSLELTLSSVSLDLPQRLFETHLPNLAHLSITFNIVPPKKKSARAMYGIIPIIRAIPTNLQSLNISDEEHNNITFADNELREIHKRVGHSLINLSIPKISTMSSSCFNSYLPTGLLGLSLPFERSVRDELLDTLKRYSFTRLQVYSHNAVHLLKSQTRLLELCMEDLPNSLVPLIPTGLTQLSLLVYRAMDEVEMDRPYLENLRSLTIDGGRCMESSIWKHATSLVELHLKGGDLDGLEDALPTTLTKLVIPKYVISSIIHVDSLIIHWDFIDHYSLSVSAQIKSEMIENLPLRHLDISNMIYGRVEREFGVLYTFPPTLHTLIVRHYTKCKLEDSEFPDSLRDLTLLDTRQNLKMDIPSTIERLTTNQLCYVQEWLSIPRLKHLKIIDRYVCHMSSFRSA